MQRIKAILMLVFLAGLPFRPGRSRRPCSCGRAWTSGNTIDWSWRGRAVVEGRGRLQSGILCHNQLDAGDMGGGIGLDCLRAGGDPATSRRFQQGRRISGNGWWKVFTSSWKDIIGHDLVQKTFWFFATIFIFILFANWLGLIPGVGTIGWGVRKCMAFHITEPLLRGANADLNMTLAMAMIFFVCWIVWALQANGPVRLHAASFAPKGETTGAVEGADGRGLLRGRASGSRFDSVPAGFAELPSLRQYFRR